jgi:hypothetical protein
LTSTWRSGIEDGGLEIRDMLMWIFGPGIPKSRRYPHGQATTLKPFYEPIVLARPLDGSSTTANVERHGTGALNVDACSIRHDDDPDIVRWPPHVIVSHDARSAMLAASTFPLSSCGTFRPGTTPTSRRVTTSTRSSSPST